MQLMTAAAKRKRRRKLLLLLSLFLFSSESKASKKGFDDGDEQPELSFMEISKLRSREIKRRLVRRHGYTPEAVAQMIDKKILIETLAYEDHLRIQKRKSAKQRRHSQKSIAIALLVVGLVLVWPLIQAPMKHLYEIVTVNFVVYTDRKCHEFGRCKELYCYPAFIGLSLVLVLDVILLWLNTSTTLSWVIPSSSIYRKYFFPVPNIPIRAGETGLALNVGGILVIWFLVWIKSSLLERFIAQRLLAAQKHRKDLRRQQRRQARRLASDAAGNAATTKLTKQKDKSHNSNGSGIVRNAADEHNQFLVSPCSMENSNIGQMGLKEQQGLQDLLTRSISESTVEVLLPPFHLEPAHRRLQYDYINEEEEQAHSLMDLD